MKLILSITILCFFSRAALAQADSSLVRSPYKATMHRVHPRLRFSEIDNEALRVLDYSGNWDIDGDGRKDSVLFIGNGGAHLYYHLRLRLSSEKKSPRLRLA